jgi:hypothetical protein
LEKQDKNQLQVAIKKMRRRKLFVLLYLTALAVMPWSGPADALQAFHGATDGTSTYLTPVQRRPDEKTDGDKSASYVLPKPELRPDIFLRFMRQLKSGASIKMEPWSPNQRDATRYQFKGKNFFGNYWEERLAQRNPTDLLTFWISSFNATCEGKFASETERPIRQGQKMVHAGSWICTTDDGVFYGYITVILFGPTASYYFTAGLSPEPARNIDAQLRAALIELIRGP